MNRSELQQLLKDELPAPAESLPDNFASRILFKGRHLRDLLEQHWKRLTIASALSLVIAIVISFGISAMFPNTDPAGPPLLLFHSSGDAAPFSTK